MNEVKNRPGIILISESSYESESSFREGLDEIINDMGYPCLARVVELPYCDPDDDYVDNKTDREEDGTDQQRDIDDWETEWDDDLTNLAREIEEFKASHDRVIIYFSVNTFIIELALAISPSVAYSFISAISGPYTTIFAEQIKVSEKDIEEYFFDILRRRSSQSFRSASPSESQTKTPALFSVDELLETDVYRRKLTEDELRERARSIAKSSIAAVENIYNVLMTIGASFRPALSVS